LLSLHENKIKYLEKNAENFEQQIILCEQKLAASNAEIERLTVYYEEKIAFQEKTYAASLISSQELLKSSELEASSLKMQILESSRLFSDYMRERDRTILNLKSGLELEEREHSAKCKDPSNEVEKSDEELEAAILQLRASVGSLSDKNAILEKV
jgi:hypothetical protein